jgi:hypothetical protein
MNFCSFLPHFLSFFGVLYLPTLPKHCKLSYQPPFFTQNKDSFENQLKKSAKSAFIKKSTPKNIGIQYLFDRTCAKDALELELQLNWYNSHW